MVQKEKERKKCAEMTPWTADRMGSEEGGEEGDDGGRRQQLGLLISCRLSESRHRWRGGGTREVI